MKSNKELRASDLIAKRLYEAGCRHAFGMPGGEVLALMEAMDQAGLEIVLVKHENCGGFMAEGAWHATGAPAVLFATIGPGIANAANVIANAWQDRVPMIVLTGCVTAQDAQSYTHQVFDHVRFLEPVTKAAFDVAAGTVGVMIDKALNIATSGRPGPVLLNLAMDVQREQSETWIEPRFTPQAAMAPAGTDLEKAQGWLQKAKQPLVLAGVDVLTQRAGDAVAGFCQMNNIPLITTYKAKGILPETDNLALGGAGLSPLADKILLPLLKQSDCLILAGYDPIEMRIGWRDLFDNNQSVIDICAQATTHYMHQAPLNFTGDIAASLAAIARGHTPAETWQTGAIARAKRDLQDAFHTDETWGPAAVANEARAACPAGTVATVDSGAHRIVLSHVWSCDHLGGLLQSSGLCTMGCAVPLAIGRKLAEPLRPVIAFVGDAGLEMYLGELATARDQKLGIPIVVFVDEELGLIALKQQGEKMAKLGVDFPPTNFTEVAEAMGGHGVTCGSRATLNAAIKMAFNRDTFTVISAIIGRNAYHGRI